MTGFCALILGIIVLLIATFSYGRVSFVDTFKVLLYHVNLTLIGFPIIFLSFSNRKIPFFVKFSFSFPLGLCVENLLFFVLSMLGARFLLFPVLLLLGLCSLLMIVIRLRNLTTYEDLELPMAGGILLVLALFMVFTALWYFPQTTLPVGKERVNIYQDIIWHLGNVQEAIYHWPLQDPRFAGHPFKYHYLFYLHPACQAIVTGVSGEVLLFRTCIPLLLVWLVILSFAFARYFWKNSYKIAVALLLVFFTASLDGLPRLNYYFFINTFFLVLFYSPTFLMNLPLFLAGILFLFYIHNQKLRVSDILILALFQWIITGSKGPGGLFILGAYGSYTVWEYVREKRIKRNHVILFLTMLIMFSFSYAILISAPGKKSPGSGIGLSPLYTVFISSFYDWAIKNPLFNKLNFPYLLRALIVVPLYFIGFFTYKIVTFKHVKEMIRKRGDMDWECVFLFSLVILSLLGWLSFEISGNSQLWFLYYGYFIISLAAGGICYDYLLNKRLILKILVLSMILASIPSIGKYFYSGILMTTQKHHLHYTGMTGISGEEVALIRRLGQLTTKDDIIFGNAFYDYEKKKALWFYGSALSSRRFLLEGWHFGGIEYTDDFNERKLLVLNVLAGKSDPGVLREKYGVTHIIWYKEHGSGENPFNRAGFRGTKLFENNAGSIYAISSGQNPQKEI